MSSASPGAADVRLSRRGALRWQSGQPWIYAADVELPTGLRGGEIVRVVDNRGQFLGQAFCSTASQIVLRRLTRDPAPIDAGFFAARIAAADALRRQLFPGENVYRAVHGEADGLPGLIVDRYGDYLSVQLLVAGTERLRDSLTGVLVEHFEPRGIANRSDQNVRRLEGLAVEKGVLYGTVPDTVPIREGHVEFGIDLLGGQKTGAFLDQRENHLRAREYARGRVLDCFSYVGGFALQMARVAATVVAVDGSQPACRMLTANAERNGIDNVTVVCANAFDYLKAEVDAGSRFDVIVLDPPAFAKNKASVAAGLRGYKEINLRAMRLLAAGGTLLTASCSYHVDEAMFEAMLAEAAADAGRQLRVIEKRGAARDHPALLGARETRYLKFIALNVV